MYQWYINQFIQYCRDGNIAQVICNLQMMETIFSVWRRFEYKLWSPAAQAACFGMHIDILIVLMKAHKFEPIDYAACVVGACEGQHMLLIRWLFEQYGEDIRAKTSHKQKGSMYRAACLHNDMKIFDFIDRELDPYTISVPRRYRMLIYSPAMRQSIKNGNIKLVEKLIAKGIYNYINYSYELGVSGNLELIEKYGGILRYYDGVDFARGATAYGNIHLLDVILGKVQGVLRPYVLEEILNEACACDRLDLIKYALHKGATPTLKLLQYAYERKTIDVSFVVFLQLCTYDDAQILVGKHGLPLTANFLRALLTHFIFPPNSLDDLFVRECGRGNIDTINVLIEHDLAIYDFGLSHAIKHEQMDVMKLMIMRGALKTLKYDNLVYYIPWLMDMGLQVKDFAPDVKLYNAARKHKLNRDVRIYHCTKVLREYGIIPPLVEIIGTYFEFLNLGAKSFSASAFSASAFSASVAAQPP